MSFTNATRLQAVDVPLMDHRGRDVVVAIVKATYEIDSAGRVVPAQDPSEIRLNDIPYDSDDARSSLRYPCDVCTEKHGTDVVLLGEAVSLKPVKVMDIGVKVRGKLVPLRVHGERLFYRDLRGVAIGPAATFERKPIVYEKAYGGVSTDLSLVEDRNPSGVGVAKRAEDLLDTPAPQIEHPAHPHTMASDRHAPVGYGAIASHWAPRREYAGTLDATWRETRMPILPVDFDVRHNNVAHPSLVFTEHLVAGDAIAVVGMRLEGVLQFELPPMPLVIKGIFDGAPSFAVRPPIDMILIEPELGRLELVVRATFPIGRGQKILREIRVDTYASGA